MVKMLITGAGFIGSNFVRYALRTHPDWHVTTLDKLTYCGRLENLHDVLDNARHTFVLGDIADSAVSAPLVRDAHIVVHFAAETHVDRSLQSAGAFIHTDVFGTFALWSGPRNESRYIRSRPTRYTGVPSGHSTEPTSCGRAIRTQPARPARIASPTATLPPTACP
jgi:dTDP-glucose 4,6-dehydratase